MEILLIILAVLAAIFCLLIGAVFALFVLTFIVYFFNLDMKLIRKVYDFLGKHYDTMKRDKKL